MVSSSNTLFEHGGRRFHLQTEDLGREAKTFVAWVYDAGTVVWQKRFDYADLIAQDLSQHDFEIALRTRMDKALLTIEAAIAKGKIP
jgi:hypothetical protein